MMLVESVEERRKQGRHFDSMHLALSCKACGGAPIAVRFFWPPEIPLIISFPAWDIHTTRTDLDSKEMDYKTHSMIHRDFNARTWIRKEWSD
eukprot:6488223-Amphidinium_carterae.2